MYADFFLIFFSIEIVISPIKKFIKHYATLMTVKRKKTKSEQKKIEK